MKRKRQPMQPIVIIDEVVRFQSNALVRLLVEHGQRTGLGLNELSRLPNIPRGDHEQLAQLIGYSVAGFGELWYARKETIERADAKAEALIEKQGPRFQCDQCGVFYMPGEQHVCKEKK